MRAQTGNTRLILVVLFVLSATLLIYYLFVRGGSVYTTENLRQERAQLVKQDIQFMGRGIDYAHYNVIAISDKGDTVVAQYRLPAAENKTKAVLWVYDESNAVNLSDALDDVTQAQFAAVLALNIHDFFSYDSKGKPEESRENIWKGLAKSKRSIDILLQFLGKHHVNDTTQIYLGGSGEATTAVLAAAATLPQRLGGLGIVNLTSSANSGELAKAREFSSAETWTDQIHVDRLALLKPAGETETAPVFSRKIDQVSFDDSFGPKSEVSTMVKWVVGADTSRVSFTADSTKVRTTTVTMR